MHLNAASVPHLQCKNNIICTKRQNIKVTFSLGTDTFLKVCINPLKVGFFHSFGNKILFGSALAGLDLHTASLILHSGYEWCERHLV